VFRRTQTTGRMYTPMGWQVLRVRRAHQWPPAKICFEPDSQFRQRWSSLFAKSNGKAPRVETVNVAKLSALPVLKHLFSSTDKPQMARVTTQDGSKFVGLVISDKQLVAVHKIHDQISSAVDLMSDSEDDVGDEDEVCPSNPADIIAAAALSEAVNAHEPPEAVNALPPEAGDAPEPAAAPVPPTAISFGSAPAYLTALAPPASLGAVGAHVELTPWEQDDDWNDAEHMDPPDGQGGIAAEDTSALGSGGGSGDSGGVATPFTPASSEPPEPAPSKKRPREVAPAPDQQRQQPKPCPAAAPPPSAQQQQQDEAAVAVPVEEAQDLLTSLKQALQDAQRAAMARRNEMLRNLVDQSVGRLTGTMVAEMLCQVDADLGRFQHVEMRLTTACSALTSAQAEAKEALAEWRKL